MVAAALARRGPAHHRALAIINLAFFTGRRGDHDPRLRPCGHLFGNGRFWFCFAAPSAAVHDDTGGFQIAADRLATDRERLLDAPKRPPEPAECEDLLLLLSSKTLLMSVTELAFRPDVNVSIATGNGRFWVSTEAYFHLDVRS